MLGNNPPVPNDMPFFSSDAFLEAFAEWYFPGARPAYVSCEGVTTRALVHRGRIGGGIWNVRTFLEPAEPPPGHAAVGVPFIPDIVRATTSIDDPPLAGLRAAPFVRWGGFESWEAYRAYASRHPEASFRTLAKRERQLASALGPVRFTVADYDEHVFDQVFEWKAEQLALRNEQNRFSVARNRAFHHELQRRGLLFASTLRADNRLVAGQIWGFAAGRRSGYLPAYDAAVERFSPGAILLLHHLRQSYEAGDEEFDFLTGTQAYKMAYGTHVRWLGNLGQETVIDRLPRLARMAAGKLLLRTPALQRRARATETALAKLRSRGNR